MRNKIPKLAAASGQETRQYLIELINAHKTQTAAARAIGVSQPTFSQWLTRCGLTRKVDTTYL